MAEAIRERLVNAIMSDYDSSRSLTYKAVDRYFQTHNEEAIQEDLESDFPKFQQLVDHIYDTQRYWK